MQTAPIYAALKMQPAAFMDWLRTALLSPEFGNVSAFQCTLALADCLENTKDGQRLIRPLLNTLGLNAFGYSKAEGRRADAFRASYGLLEFFSGDADLFSDCYTA